MNLMFYLNTDLQFLTDVNKRMCDLHVDNVILLVCFLLQVLCKICLLWTLHRSLNRTSTVKRFAFSGETSRVYMFGSRWVKSLHRSWSAACFWQTIGGNEWVRFCSELQGEAGTSCRNPTCSSNHFHFSLYRLMVFKTTLATALSLSNIIPDQNVKL